MGLKEVQEKYLRDIEIRGLKDRLELIENKVFKNERKSLTTRSQQMLLFLHLGLLDKINELDISQIAKAELLSTLLNASKDNIKKDLSDIYKKDSVLASEQNYEFITSVFEKAGLESLAMKTDKILNDIKNAKDQ